MKKENIPELKRKAFRLLPMSQANLAKKLNLSSQDISELAKLMLNEKVLKRKSIYENGRKTYMLSRGNVDNFKKVEPKKFKSLLRGNMFSPCTGCPEPVCAPVFCNQLTEWISA